MYWEEFFIIKKGEEMILLFLNYISMLIYDRSGTKAFNEGVVFY